MRRFWGGCCAAALMSISPAFAQATDRIALAAHRAVYDLQLVGSRGMKGVEAAKGRIVYELTGNACEGYALNFRQVTQIESSEIGARMSDSRTTTFETGAGDAFRFKSESRGGDKQDSAEGRAALKPDGAVAVEFTSPPGAVSHADEGPVLFPNAHTKRLIELARKDERILAVKIFDGGEQGRKVYDTLSVIGKRIAPGVVEGAEAPARIPELGTLPSWPVTISYFEPGQGERTPLYVISFVMYDNGISRSLRIDYGDFSLKGDLSKLEMLTAGACDK